jgi:hypothetical protein
MQDSGINLPQMHVNNKDNLIDMLLIVTCFIASGLLAVYMGQDGNWDLRNYHFYNAYSFLNNRLTYDVAPAHMNSFLNPLLDVPFYLLVTNLPPIFVGFLIGGVQGLSIWLIYKIVYYILIDTDISGITKHLLSVVAGVTGFYGAANLSEIGTTFYDNIMSLFVLGALLIIVSSMQNSKTRKIRVSNKSIIASGLILGCATGLKLTVAIYSLSFIFSFLFVDSSWRARIRNALMSCLAMSIGFIITMGYWMTVLWNNFESPLFPYYNAVFKSPYYELKNFIYHVFFPRDIYQTVFYPFYFIKRQKLVSEVWFRDIRFAVCYILFVLLIFILYYKWVNRNYGHHGSINKFEISNNLKKIYFFLIIFFVSSYILWQSTFSIYRYIIPLELLAPVFIILIIQYIFPFNRIFVPLSLGTFALIMVAVVPMNWGRVPWGQDYFDVRIQEIENIADSTIIMAGYEPLAYIIPFFPESTRFVRVHSYFLHPSSDTLLQVKIRKLLKKSKTLYLLYKEKHKNKEKVDYNSILKFYNLKITKQNFIKISTRFDDDLFLFPVSQLN